MKIGLLIILVLAVSASAQSGRAKPTATPTPKTITGPSVLSVPVPVSRGTSSPTPATSSPKAVDDDVIRVDAALVPIPVSVTDATGRSITTLKIDDFELKIDGRTAEIAEIHRAETPIRLAMLFDNSGSVAAAREFEKDAAIRFFRHVIRPDRDQAALFSVADYTQLEQALTRDVQQLTRAIEAFPPPSGATALLDGLLKVADYLRSVDGRRVIIVVSDGEDNYSDASFENVVKALQIANCQVYVVKTKDFENFKVTGARIGNANIQALTAEHRMKEITKQTGGAVYSPIDEREMKDAFDRISAELSQQYVLSYYPEGERAKAGDFRSISVSVKGKNTMTVRTRKGYYVPKR